MLDYMTDFSWLSCQKEEGMEMLGQVDETNQVRDRHRCWDLMRHVCMLFGDQVRLNIIFAHPWSNIM